MLTLPKANLTWLSGIIFAVVGVMLGGTAVMAYSTLREYAVASRTTIVRHTEVISEIESRLRVLEANSVWLQKTLGEVREDTRTIRKLVEESLQQVRTVPRTE